MPGPAGAATPYTTQVLTNYWGQLYRHRTSHSQWIACYTTLVLSLCTCATYKIRPLHSSNSDSLGRSQM